MLDTEDGVATNMPLSIALIGSFRERNYPKVVACIDLFSRSGLNIVSPQGAAIVSGVEFVRFATDPLHLSDPEIQSLTMDKILGADAVYVVTGPDGYVGRTTCYEVGRIIQARQPLYFSEVPDDLPVHIRGENVASPAEFVLRFVTRRETPVWPFQDGVGDLFDVERRLIDGPQG